MPNLERMQGHARWLSQRVPTREAVCESVRPTGRGELACGSNGEREHGRRAEPSRLAGDNDTYRLDIRVPDGTAPGMAVLQVTAAFIAGQEVSILVQ